MTYLYAFLCGGAICAFAQILINKTKMTPARILVSFVVIGVILSALGLYQPFVDFAGGGATVPLTGFGHLLAKGVEKAIDKDGAIGILTGGLTGASAGLCAVILFSFVASLIFKGKKNG